MNTEARIGGRRITAASLLQQLADERVRLLDERCKVPMGSDPFLPQVTPEEQAMKDSVRAFALAAYRAQTPDTPEGISTEETELAEVIDIVSYRQTHPERNVGAIALQSQ
jgi:hypothetical protein